MRLARALLRNKGFLVACGIAAWAGLEVGGKGTGIINWLFSPGLTREQGFHPLDIVGARPKGPVRLTEEDAAVVDARLAKAFGANVPAHRRTSTMREYYELKADARCVKDSVDLLECNKVARMEVFFAAVLRAMHPATEHVLWLERKTKESGPGRGQPIQVAVFMGPDEKVKLAFDLRQVKRSGEFKTFTVRAFDTSGLRDLVAREEGEGELIVDDPGPLEIPRGFAAEVLVYGGTNPPENGIISLQMEGDMIVRDRFFAAVLVEPAENGSMMWLTVLRALPVWARAAIGSVVLVWIWGIWRIGRAGLVRVAFAVIVGAVLWQATAGQSMFGQRVSVILATAAGAGVMVMQGLLVPGRWQAWRRPFWCAGLALSFVALWWVAAWYPAPCVGRQPCLVGCPGGRPTQECGSGFELSSPDREKRIDERGPIRRRWGPIFIEPAEYLGLLLGLLWFGFGMGGAGALIGWAAEGVANRTHENGGGGEANENPAGSGHSALDKWRARRSRQNKTGAGE